MDSGAGGVKKVFCAYVFTPWSIFGKENVFFCFSITLFITFRRAIFFSSRDPEIDLCHAFENLMLALGKYQKWKEQVKVSEYQRFGDLILKTMALVQFLETGNLTENVWELYFGRALMPVQPRYHANTNTFPF